MLNLIKSNKIELITEVLAKELLINPPSVTEQIDISVDDYLLSKWMRDQITIKNQISALYEFKSINNFTEELIKKLYPSYSIVNWDYDLLLWIIINSLEDISNYKESWPLSNWLNKYNLINKIIDKDIYILCNKIAKIYSEYMIFRPEMINNWHAFDFAKDNLFRDLDFKDYWQPVLFKIIERKIGFKSLPYLIFDFINNCDSRKFEIKKLIPKQIYIVAINNLSKLQISFYLNISRFTRVNIYQLSYGEDLWNRLNIDQGIVFKNEFERFQVNNIEKIFGKYGSDFEKLLDETVNNLQIEINYKPFYSNPEKEDSYGRISLLNQLQKKIIDNNQIELEIFKDDESFRLFAHSDIIHQLEFIRDQIINLIKTNKEIKFIDIAIATPFLGNITPHIKSIFEDEFINGQKIPYIFANENYSEISNIFRLIIDYIDIASSKITIKKLSLFFNDKCIKDIFQLSTKDVEEIIKLLEESGFDWGLDTDERSGEFKNTLDWCIQRITLGMLFEDNIFMDNSEISSFNVNNNYMDLHKCIDILNRFKNDINSLRGEFNLREWVNKIKNILFNLRSNNNSYNDQINELNLFLDKYLNKVQCNDLLDIYVIKEILLKNINKPKNILINRNNQILIGDLKNIRLIPHKVIFLIDVNNKYYPRKFKEENMNLINKFFIFGDSIKINKEKYLFLELLMSCRDKFIVTWSNYDKNNNKLEISPPIRQLIYYLENLIDETKIAQIINNQNKKLLEDKDSKIFLDQQKYSLINNIQWNSKIYENKNYKLSEIIFWFREPQIYWLRKNNLNFRRLFNNNPNEENINGLQKTKLMNNIINNIKLDNIKLDENLENLKLHEYLIHNGIFAPGNSLYLKENQLRDLIDSLIDKISGLKTINKICFKEESNKEEYFISDNKIIELINSNLNIHKISESWIRLLFASSLNDDIQGTKIFYRLNNQYKDKDIISPGSLESRNLLFKYINIYKNGINKCLPIPPESSFNFIDAKFSLKNAENAFIKSWIGTDGFIKGERDKPEMIFCFGEEVSPELFLSSQTFLDLSSEMYLPLIKSLKS